jgi:hypothetical protein
MKKTLMAMSVASVMGLSGLAMAATNGDVGATSEGTVDITLTIPPLIQIIVDGDVDLGTFDPVTDTDRTATAAACVRTNGTPTYDITASSTSGGTGFQLADGSSNFIDYTFSWDGVELAEGALNDNAGAGFARDNMGPGFSACTAAAGRISVTVLEADMLAAEAGVFTDTVELLVAPH